MSCELRAIRAMPDLESLRYWAEEARRAELGGDAEAGARAKWLELQAVAIEALRDAYEARKLMRGEA